MKQLYRNLILAGVLVGTAALSAYAFQADVAPPGRAAASAAAQPNDQALAEGERVAVIRGRVEETIDVPKYTYLRIKQEGGTDVWTAVPTAQIEKGATATVVNPQEMRQFKSNTLNRTFDVIYFGQLGRPGATHGDDASGLPPGHPGAGAVPENPHAGTQRSSGDDVPVGKVAKATGPGASTIAELYAAASQQAGKEVRVRGVVVKAVPNVMKRTFLHLRDGTGEAGAGTHDVTVTTSAAPPAIGTTVVVEGKVATDRDFGAGYTYKVLIEDAELVTE